jgi:hypothetical protein
MQNPSARWGKLQIFQKIEILWAEFSLWKCHRSTPLLTNTCEYVSCQSKAQFPNWRESTCTAIPSDHLEKVDPRHVHQRIQLELAEFIVLATPTAAALRGSFLGGSSATGAERPCDGLMDSDVATLRCWEKRIDVAPQFLFPERLFFGFLNVWIDGTS